MLVTIDRVRQIHLSELHERATRRMELWGTHFTSPGNGCSAAKKLKGMIERGELLHAHSFDYACAQSDIDDRMTKRNHLGVSRI